MEPYYKKIIEISDLFKKENIKISFKDKTSLDKMLKFLKTNKKEIEIIDKGLKNLEKLLYLKININKNKSKNIFDEMNVCIKDGIFTTDKDFEQEGKKFQDIYSRLDPCINFIFYFQICLKYIDGKNIKEREENLYKNLSKLAIFYDNISKEKSELEKKNKEKQVFGFSKLESIEIATLYDKLKNDMLNLEFFLRYTLLSQHSILSTSFVTHNALERIIKSLK